MSASVVYQEVLQDTFDGTSATKRKPSYFQDKNPYALGLGNATCFDVSNLGRCISLSAATAVPCYYLGLIESMTSREEKVFCSLGKLGCSEMLLTSFLTVLGWPCPFLFIFYVHNKKQNYRIIYEDHSDLSTSKITDSCSSCLIKIEDLLYSFCLWPCNVLQIYNYLIEKDKHGLLRFNWEESTMVLNDLKVPMKSVKTQKVAIIGSQGCGKTMLLHKILSTSSAKDIVFSNEKSHGGIRTVHHNNNGSDKISVLEAWEIAEIEFNSDYFINQMLKTFEIVIFMYDLSDLTKKSFEDLKSYYYKSIGQMEASQQIIILANRLDMCRSDYSKDSPSKQKVCFETLEQPYLDVHSIVNSWVTDEVNMHSQIEAKHIVLSCLEVDATEKFKKTIHFILDKDT
jgi:GTPase SAR1 family protein